MKHLFEQLLAIATTLLLFILLYASTATNISKKQFKAKTQLGSDITVTVVRQFSDDGQMATTY